MNDQYAFGEMDEVGKTSLAAFAAESDQKPIDSHPDMEDLPFKIVRMQTLRAN